MPTTTRPPNQKKPTIQLQPQEDEQDDLDELPMSQASMTSSDAGCVFTLYCPDF